MRSVEEIIMGRNIVFCADGTWNGPGRDDNDDGVPEATNVLRLFALLAGKDAPSSLRLRDEQEKATPDAAGAAQIAKYIHGVGDSRNPITKILGGVFGEGYIQRIVRGYTFISRNYAPGDRIFICGFSRGAYTARALGGMIARVGLLKRDAMFSPRGDYDAERAYRMGIHMWARYRESAGKRSTLIGYLQEFNGQDVRDDQLEPVDAIQAIAVWDTVGSLGVPIYRREDGGPLDVFAFADTALSPKVKRGFHAVAIDEERENFTPTLWDERAGIEQVWFAGAHADVGGGYPELALSDISLGWMINRLAKEGVLFDPAYQPAALQRHPPCSRPWTQVPFNAFGHGPRKHPATAKFHAHVQDRLIACPDYQPASLRNFLVADRLPAERLVPL
jgi:uncharacterized protein (DUF2235 family)